MKSIVWLRKDIRLRDNKALAYALLESDEVYPVFIFDKRLLNDKRSNPARNYFLKKSLEEIKDKVTFLEGDPIEELEKFIVKHKINSLYYNKDYSPFAIKRDEQLEKLNITIKPFKDLTIFENLEINTNGKPYTVFTPYKKRFLSQLTPDHYKEFTLKINYYSKIQKVRTFDVDNVIGDDGKEVINKSPFTPGEKAAQKTLKDFIINKLDNYEEKRNFPSIEGTSRLSAHLHFGTISIRQCLRAAIESKKNSKAWVNELIWRDFYYSIISNFPYVINEEFSAKFKGMRWDLDKDKFEAWCNGKTGYPIIDAAMRCLNTTGWMHNRLRMITASFLVKDLHIDWRMGEKYFMQKLIDADIAANNGGWQWVAGTGTDASPYFRIFSPEEQTKKFDPNNEFIKKWIPELETDTYPNPIIDHKIERKIAIDIYNREKSDIRYN